MDMLSANSKVSSNSQVFHGAKWIGTDFLALSAHTQAVFLLQVSLQLEQNSTRASFLLGGNDLRLQNKNLNLQGAQAGVNESYIELMLDISPLKAGKTAVLCIYRHGYAPGDGTAPLYRLPIPALSVSTAWSPHCIGLDCIYGEMDLTFDGVPLKPEMQASDRRDGAGPLNLNPIGRGGNFICFPLLCDIGVKLESGQSAVFSDLCIYNLRPPRNPLLEGFPKALLGGGDVLTVHGGDSGLLRLADPSHDGIPMLRTEFTLTKPVKYARLYATARGIYVCSLNGKAVGQDVLMPGLSQYNRSHYYQTYDVTADLFQGKNVLGVELSEGWWSGAITFSGDKWNYFGDRQSFLGCLVITYSDGTEEQIVTDPACWRCTTGGPVRYGSLFQGEIYDARREIPGWDQPDFNDADWDHAQEVVLSKENAFIGDMTLMPFGQKVSLKYDGFQLRRQQDESVRVRKRIPAVRLTEPRPGVYIYDLGQNIAGVPEIRLNGQSGQRVLLRYAEMLYPDLPEYAAQKGMLMLENIRGALAQDQVFLKEGYQTIRPRFTFHGFRYLEITGIAEPLPLDAVTGLAYSSVDVTTEFSCSHEPLNRLYQNIAWSLRDNFLSIPTDCPQRNERMGWSGDLSVFSRTAIAMANCRDFLERQLQALRDTQSPEGRFDDVAPVGGGFGGILWGSAGVVVAWELYRRFGDKAQLRLHYPAICRYLRYLRTRLNPETGLINEGPLGDWLGPEYTKNEPAFLWQSYYVYDLRIGMDTARILEEPEDFTEFQRDYARAKGLLHQVFFDQDTGVTVYSGEEAARGTPMGPPSAGSGRPLPERLPSGKYRMDTQTSYAVPLALGILEPETAEKARQHLLETVRRENTDDSGSRRPAHSLMTGFIGTAWICPALTIAGGAEDAWRLLLQEEYPSWLYPVCQGATTIWERLDSFTWERGFGGNNSMNSFNHYSFGAVGDWLLSEVLGFYITAPGRISLMPTPDPTGTVTWAGGAMETRQGRVESAWEQVSHTVTRYRFCIPQNTSLEAALPGAPDGMVFDCDRQCRLDAEYAEGRLRVMLDGGVHTLEVRA